MSKQIKKQLAEGILYTDMYQLTMAQLYFRHGLHERVARFDHFFRSNPDYGIHQAGYCINAGQEWLLDWMEEARFGDAEIDYLRQQTGTTGERLFADDFLAWLRRDGHFGSVSLTAIPEGRVVHPNVPVTIVEGPLAMAQILETALLNMLNYPILIATRASRVSQAGRGQLLLEFGMRRGQERGVNAGARAALIGGASFSSNVGLSQAVGYPAKGTHAHSLIQLFMALGEGELGAFRAYAELYPDDCVLLVDTVNTLRSGVPNAIKVFEELRAKGHQPAGIRLDSGDLAYLAVRAAKMLDEAGFADVAIVLSSSLDELTILQILAQIQDEATRYGVDADAISKRLIYGVGTNLITSRGHAALDGVYKLVAVSDQQNGWLPAIKISDNPVKTPNPGSKNVWRIYDQRGQATADLIGLDDEDPRQGDRLLLRHPTEVNTYRFLEPDRITEIEPLLEPAWTQGKRAGEQVTIETMRQRRIADLERLDAGVRRLINPHIYHVSLTEKLWQLKQELIRSHRNGI